MPKTVLIVWHGALFPSYRKPFWLLQERFGWDVHLLTTTSWRKALPRKVSFQPSEEEPIAVYPRRTWFKFHGAIHFQPSFLTLFHRVKPDIVFSIEEPFSLMGWLSVYWGGRAVPNTPVVVYSYQDIEKRYPPPFRWLEQYVYKHAERILVSNPAAGRVLENKGYKKQWDTLPAAVNLDRFPFREPPPPSACFTIGYVGRLVEEKGIDTLLWALTNLNDNVRLHLVGDGSARFRLETLARELGVYERVAFRPPVSHEDLASVYHEFDALALPSKTTPQWQEQFGRVLIEAMACGVPVIGSDSGAIPEVIGGAGLIFPEGQAGQLTERILQIANDTDLQRRLSYQGRIRVEQNYTPQKIAEQMHRHFIELIR